MEPPIKDPLRNEQPQESPLLLCPKVIFSHRNNAFLYLLEEDNLSIVDKMAGPKVSIIWRFRPENMQANYSR